MPDLTRLDTLHMTEVSGVDDPANELPGWMVTKARGLTLDQLREQVGDEEFVRLVQVAVRDLRKDSRRVVETLDAEEVLKAHRHPTTGRFQSAPASDLAPEEAPEEQTTLLPIYASGGAVHPAIARELAAASGKKTPSGGDPIIHGTYGGKDGAPSPDGPNPGGNL